MRWTDREDTILYRERVRGAAWRLRAHATLPHRTVHAINARIYRLAQAERPSRIVPWTADEDAIIRQERQRGQGWRHRAKARLPQRTMAAIDRRMQVLKDPSLMPWRTPARYDGLHPGLASLAHALRH